MSAPGSPVPARHAELLAKHAEAKRRREAAALGSEEFRAACEEVALVEIAIAAAEEPPPRSPASAADAPSASSPAPG